MTDETLENRKKEVPNAEKIIDEIMSEFIEWNKGRKYAPTIHAIKTRLEAIKEIELTNHKKKNSTFDEKQIEMITNKMIQKITNHFAHHLKKEDTQLDESLAVINKIFQLETK
jgi:glutamyl-tRNA reductase